MLLVEDVDYNRDIYRTMLEFGGHEVTEALNGVEALAIVHDLRPDLIVMDVTMPIMDGLEATRRLKADARTCSIPVLILTAHAFASDQAEAIQAGADAYLSKPCVPRVVLQTAERLLTR